MKTLTEELIKQASETTSDGIELDGEETAQFFDERHSGIWDGIYVVRSLGDRIKLPWRALPTRQHADERYFVKNGTEIKPAFAFWGLGNTLRRTCNVAN